MKPSYEIITVNASNIDQTGFFCYMSKRKSPGYRQKRQWLKDRFSEGMQVKILHEIGGRDVGFIEYIPGEFAWRAVHAPGYLVIHCLWVVGKGKGKGYGSILIQECLEEARAQGKHGVAMVTSDRVWLAGRKVFERNGFVEVDQAPPTFQLMVYPLDNGPAPYFPSDWEARQAHFGSGLTVVRTPQCPYIEDASQATLETGQARGIPARIVELGSAQEVREQAPCAYGVFSIVYNGRLLSYYYLLPKDYAKLLGDSA